MKALFALYPLLQGDYRAVEKALLALEESGASYRVFPTYSEVSGKEEEVFLTLQRAFQKAAEEGALVMWALLTNACEAGDPFRKEERLRRFPPGEIARKALEGLKVKDLMTPNPIVLPPDLPVGEALALALRHKVSGFPVVAEGRILGVVGLEGLEGANPLDPVARHLLPPLLLSPEEDALTALERMAERGYARALVVEGDRLLGVLSKTDLLRAFQVRLLGLSHLDRPKGPE